MKITLSEIGSLLLQSFGTALLLSFIIWKMAY
jgi:hypothetical protein